MGLMDKKGSRFEAFPVERSQAKSEGEGLQVLVLRPMYNGKATGKREKVLR